MEAPASADPFLEKLAAGLGAQPKSRRALVAVSGGRDSVALLHGLHTLGRRKLTVIHLDHQLRGTASRADARFVERLAAKLGLPAIVGRAEVKEYARERGLSVEHAARELRHVFFAAVARRERCSTVFLAHHVGDQVETCLFNFLRGSGAAGLAGMRPETELAIGRTALRLIRPMLAIRREEIDAYLARHRLKYRDDATNAEIAATRNRLRHLVLPAMSEAVGNSFPDAILRASEILAAEEDWMKAEAARIPVPPELRLDSVRGLPLALTRRVLRRWLEAREIEAVSFEAVERVRALLDPGARVAKTNLPGDAHCRRRAGVLFIERP